MPLSFSHLNFLQMQLQSSLLLVFSGMQYVHNSVCMCVQFFKPKCQYIIHAVLNIAFFLLNMYLEVLGVTKILKLFHGWVRLGHQFTPCCLFPVAPKGKQHMLLKFLFWSETWIIKWDIVIWLLLPYDYFSFFVSSFFFSFFACYGLFFLKFFFSIALCVVIFLKLSLEQGKEWILTHQRGNMQRGTSVNEYFHPLMV